jgi:hypothetical protein
METNNGRAFTDYVKKIIRVRTNLIRYGRSHKPDSIQDDIRGLEATMPRAGVVTDYTGALFFRMNAAKIYNMIPGEGCKCHKKLADEFIEFYKKADVYAGA